MSASSLWPWEDVSSKIFLPPAYTFVCTDEPFYCETLTFVENLRAAGVNAGLDERPEELLCKE